MRLALTVLALLAASPAAADALPHFAQDTPYTTVRKKLIAMGYKPYKAPGADKCDIAIDKRCFPEIGSCAGSGLGECNFEWKKGDARIEIGTINTPPTFDWIGRPRSDVPN